MIKIYVDSGNGVGIQTDNLRTADTECFRTKGAVNNNYLAIISIEHICKSYETKVQREWTE